MSRRTQRATAVALSALLIPVLAGCVMQPGTDEETTPPETTTVEETEATTDEPVEETETTDDTATDATTFTDADDFLSQYESAVEPCVDTQTQDVASLVGEQSEALGLDGATMGSCLVDETGSYASAVVLPDTSASINDERPRPPASSRACSRAHRATASWSAATGSSSSRVFPTPMSSAHSAARRSPRNSPNRKAPALCGGFSV